MKYHLIGLQRNYLLDASSIASLSELRCFISANEGVPCEHQRFLIGGRDVHALPNSNSDCDDAVVSIKLALSVGGGMPKKKKGKGKKGKKGKDKKKKVEEEAKPDEFDFMNASELLKIKAVLSEKLSTIQEERSYFQLERDFLQKMYDIVHTHEFAENAVNFKNMESDLEALKNNHRNNIRMYVQKVKHLEYDHNNTMNSISMEAEMLQTEEKLAHQKKKEKLLRNKKILESELLKTKMLNEREIAAIEVKLGLAQRDISADFEAKLVDLHASYERILLELKKDLELQTKLQIHEIEERKNLHINDLIFNHEKSFNKMKEYYNSITRDNLDLIRSLKTELGELEAKIKSHESKHHNILSENKKLNLPLNKAKSEVALLNKRLVNYNKDKRSLKSNQKHLLSLTNKLNVLKKQNAELKQQYQRLCESKSELCRKYASIAVRQKEKSALSQKLMASQQRFKAKQDELNQVLGRANLDKVVISHLTNKLNTIIDHKNSQIAEKRYEVSKVHKMHDDLLRVYQAKIKKLCPQIPDHELFHVQHINHVKGATIPANFISN